jgi:Restriction endonuclease/Pentapeptide repeats (8 copies)
MLKQEIVRRLVEDPRSLASLYSYGSPGLDLSEISIESADLRGVNLRRANLRNSEFKNIDFSGANLTQTDLSGAHLFNVNLRNANLSMAKLRKADLHAVDLRSAVLLGSDLSYSRLSEVHFTTEEESNSVASFLDLAGVHGLATVKFDSADFLPSYVERAFRYAHRQDIPEGQWPYVVADAVEAIVNLRTLTHFGEPSSVLVEVIGHLSSQLIDYLSKHPKALYSLRARQFEELVAEILAGFGWSVELTPATRDGGFDLFAISRDISGLRSSWIVECKKYSPENKVGVDIVRSVYGIQTDKRIANVLLATTSFFTDDAKRFKAERYDLELRDYDGIVEWLGTYLPRREGGLYIEDRSLGLSLQKQGTKERKL